MGVLTEINFTCLLCKLSHVSLCCISRLRYMYWSTVDAIHRAGLDGSAPEVFVSHETHSPDGMAINYKDNRYATLKYIINYKDNRYTTLKKYNQIT